MTKIFINGHELTLTLDTRSQSSERRGEEKTRASHHTRKSKRGGKRGNARSWERERKSACECCARRTWTERQKKWNSEKRSLIYTLTPLLLSRSLLHVNVRECVRERLPISITRQSSRLFFIFRSQCVMAATQFSIQWKSNFSSLLISRVDRLDRTEIDCSDNFQVPFGSDRSDQIGWTFLAGSLNAKKTLTATVSLCCATKETERPKREAGDWN